MPTVVDTMLKDGGDRLFVLVVPVEQAYPAKLVKTDGIAVEAGEPLGRRFGAPERARRVIVQQTTPFVAVAR